MVEAFVHKYIFAGTKTLILAISHVFESVFFCMCGPNKVYIYMVNVITRNERNASYSTLTPFTMPVYS